MNYVLLIQSPCFAALKAEALERTAHMRLKATDLNAFYIGYRQLTTSELNRYDEANPPPVPYTFTDQINVTAYATAFMPSCLHFTVGDDEWRSGGCNVSRSLGCLCHLISEMCHPHHHPLSCVFFLYIYKMVCRSLCHRLRMRFSATALSSSHPREEIFKRQVPTTNLHQMPSSLQPNMQAHSLHISNGITNPLYSDKYINISFV